MLAFLYRYKIIIPILIISILYNLIFFSIFIFILLRYHEFRVTITLTFLLFYTLLALPLKDWFIHSIFYRFLYPEPGPDVVRDRRVKDLHNTSDINRLLKILVRELNLTGLSMVTAGREQKTLHFTWDPESANPSNIKAYEFDSLSRCFQSGFRKVFAGNMPDEIKQITDKYKWTVLVPIFYKSKYFGFLAVWGSLEIKKTRILEDLAGRIGLLTENEILTESAMKNKSFEKEFIHARQIEKLLQVKQTTNIHNYHVIADQKNFESMHFPVLFERSQHSAGNATRFFIFCRMSKSNKRMRTMMLFMIAGYFLAHSKYAKNLRELSAMIGNSISENGTEFSIDGFIMQAASNDLWKIAYFGKNIQIMVDTKIIKLDDTNALGSSKQEKLNVIEVKNKPEIGLAINHITGVKIYKNEN